MLILDSLEEGDGVIVNDLDPMYVNGRREYRNRVLDTNHHVLRVSNENLLKDVVWNHSYNRVIYADPPWTENEVYPVEVIRKP